MTECPHPDVEPVTLLDGTHVRNLCVNCGDELPVEWGCTNCTWIEERVLCQPWPNVVLATPCHDHRLLEARR